MNNILTIIFTLFSILIRDSSAMEVMPCHGESIVPKMNYLHVGSFNNQTGDEVKLDIICDIHISKDYIPIVCNVLTLKKSINHIYLLLNDQLIPLVAQNCLKRVDFDLKKLTFAKLTEWKVSSSQIDVEKDFLPSQFTIKSNLLKFYRSQLDNQSIILNLVCTKLSFQLYPLDIRGENNHLIQGIRICSPLEFNRFRDIFILNESSLFSFLPRELIGIIISILMSLNTLDPSICYVEEDHWDDFSFTESYDYSEDLGDEAEFVDIVI